MRSDAQKKADRNYLKKQRETGKLIQFNIGVSASEKEFIIDNAKKRDMTNARFIFACCQYIIKNNIDVSKYIKIDDNSNDTNTDK